MHRVFLLKLISILPGLFFFISVRAQNWSLVNGRAIEQYREGKYQEAIQSADEALAIAQDKFGVNSDPYLSSLTNKAYAQSALGDQRKALTNFKKAAIISFNLYTLPHVSQIETLEELAKTFVAVASYDSAEFYLNLATSVYLSVREKNRAHYDTATLQLINAYVKINALDASLHRRKGQTAQAIQLLEYQVSLIKDVYGDEYVADPDYKTTISNLAAYYNELANVEEARKYALEYYSLVNACDTLDRIHALQNLGGIYRNAEQNDSAFYYWRRAASLAEAGNYQRSYIYTAVLNNLGELYAQVENYDAAIHTLKKSLTIQSSKETTDPALYQTTLYNLAESYHWSRRYPQADSVYDTLIRQVLDEIVHNFTYLSDNEKLSFYNHQASVIRDFASFAVEISAFPALQGSDHPYIDPEIPGRLYDLQLTTKAIILNASRRMKNAILNSGDTVLIRIYSLWEERKNRLAQALLDGKSSPEEVAQLKAKIEENEKWLTANSRNFQSGFEVKPVSWRDVQQSLKPDEAAVEIIRLIDGLIYGALIVTPETKQQPVFSLIMSTRSKRLEKHFYQNYYNSIIYKLDDTLSYNTYWKPVIDSIRRHMPLDKMPQRIYISNDGIYNQINLNTLKNPAAGKYVLDETDIVVLTNTKELLNNDSKKITKNKNAALFGRPKFSEHDGARAIFTDLPATKKEVELVNDALNSAHWKTQVFDEENATERHLKQLHEPTVLHLASHGFFNPAADEQQQSLAETMIRSGIALAGANDTLRLEDDDGLLTAFEVIGLNLDSTRLVVLSACETGKGVENNGEGVYGLQRALRVAGARNMIMSLWKVDDTATQKLMVNFYSYWTKTGDMRKSFRTAQQVLRKEYPSPYYWGAFILAGR